MKTEVLIIKILCMGLVVAFLTICTIYKPVQAYPHEVNTKKTILLHKGELKFLLENPQVKQDTIFARARLYTGEVMKKYKLTIVLKPDIELSRAQDGSTSIPFNAIDHIKYYEKDIQKSRNARIIGVSVGIMTGFLVYLLVLYITFL